MNMIISWAFMTETNTSIGEKMTKIVKLQITGKHVSIFNIFLSRVDASILHQHL